MNKTLEFFSLNRKRFEMCAEWGRQGEVQIVPQVSKLQLRVKLQQGVGNYNFQLASETVDGKLGDVGLNRNDLFIPFNLALFHQFDNVPNDGKAPFFSYPIKATDAHRGYLTEDIEALYSTGKILIRLDQTQVNESLPVAGLRYVPETQPVVLVNGTTLMSAGIEPQFNLADAALQLVPTYKLQGTFDTRIELQFNGTGSDFSIAEAGQTTASAEHEAWLILYMEGVLLKSAADAAKINPLEPYLQQQA